MYMVCKLPPNVRRNAVRSPAKNVFLDCSLKTFCERRWTKFPPNENAPRKVDAKRVASIRLNVILLGSADNRVRTAVDRCPR